MLKIRKKELIDETKRVLKYPYMKEFINLYGNKERLVYDFVEHAISRGYIYENPGGWCSLIKKFVQSSVSKENIEPFSLRTLKRLEICKERLNNYFKVQYNEIDVHNLCTLLEKDKIGVVNGIGLHHFLAIGHLSSTSGLSLSGVIKKIESEVEYRNEFYILSKTIESVIDKSNNKWV